MDNDAESTIFNLMKKNILGARCADESIVSLTVVRASEGSEGAGELHSASLLSSSVKCFFVFVPLARFPFLLSHVGIT